MFAGIRQTLAALAAAALLVLGPGPLIAETEGDARTEAAFQAALAAIEGGRPQDAVAILTPLQAANPGAVRIRLELARAHYLAGDLRAARRHFRTIMGRPDVPVAVKQNVATFLRAIETRTGLSDGFQLQLSVPTGSGRRYDTDDVRLDLFGGQPLTFTLDRPEPPGLMLEAEYRIRKDFEPFDASSAPVGNPFVRGRIAARKAERNVHDSVAFDLGAGIRMRWPATTASSELFVTREILREGVSEEGLGIALDIARQLPASLVLSGRLDLTEVERPSNLAANGRLIGAHVALRQATGGDNGAAVTLSAATFVADRDDYTYDAITLEGSYGLDIGQVHARGALTAEVFRQEAATPGFLTARSEREFGARITLQPRDAFLFGRYAPFFSVSATSRESNIDAFSYREIRTEIGVRSQF